MRRPELDYILSTMLDSQPEVSDLLFTVDKPLQVESFGELKPVSLRSAHREAHAVPDRDGGAQPDGRQPVAHRGSAAARLLRHRLHADRQGPLPHQHLLAARQLLHRAAQAQHRIPTLEWLKFPEIIKQIPREKTGLVLVTGATGSGKSTTLAAILNEINHTKPVHIITLEDPVEFVHPHDMATFNQRELGTDFDTFSNGLRAALRQAPKVILVGEMRDRETIKIALSAAETGHLVLEHAAHD